MILRRVGLAISFETAPACFCARTLIAHVHTGCSSSLQEEGFHGRNPQSLFHYYSKYLTLPAVSATRSRWRAPDHDDYGSPGGWAKWQRRQASAWRRSTSRRARRSASGARWTSRRPRRWSTARQWPPRRWWSSRAAWWSTWFPQRRPCAFKWRAT